MRPGASEGQTSRTGQGAWSTTKRLTGLRLRGPRRVRSPSHGQDEQVGVLGGGDDLAFDASDAFGAGARLTEAVGGGLEQPLCGDGGQLFHAGAGIALVAARSPSLPTASTFFSKLSGCQRGSTWRMSVTSYSLAGLAGWENSGTAPIGLLICMVPDVLRHAFSRELLFVVGP